ncbi:MAG: cupin-like domain-containing protein [Pseudomonadales bacterium]
MDTAEPLITEWAPTSFNDLETGIWCGQQRLADSALFSMSALAELIAKHPRDAMHIHTMFGDSTAPEYLDIEAGDLASDDILEAINKGRIWLSLVNLQEYHPDVNQLLEQTYAELGARCQGFKPSRLIANLLISSPSTEVFYHADAYSGMLWQLHGQKRVYVYPPWDDNFLSPASRELCLAGQLMDDLFLPEFDQAAEVFDLKPGQFLSWPQTTPHRVVNQQGLNISFATEHDTAIAARRRTTAAANWWFRQNLGLNSHNVSYATADSVSTNLKRYLFLGLRTAAKIVGRRLTLPADEPVTATLRLDPNDPRGLSEL